MQKLAQTPIGALTRSPRIEGISPLVDQKGLRLPRGLEMRLYGPLTDITRGTSSEEGTFRINCAILLPVIILGEKREGCLIFGPEVAPRTEHEAKTRWAQLQGKEDREALIRFNASQDEPDRRVQLCIPLSTGNFFGNAALSREPRTVSAQQAEQLAESGDQYVRRFLSDYSPGEFHCLPVRNNGSPLGVLIVYNKFTMATISGKRLDELKGAAEEIAAMLHSELVDLKIGLTLPHELRNPLAAIGGFSRLLLSEVGALGDSITPGQRERLKQYAEIIVESTERLEKAVDGITEN